jgi:hypothetical protein
MSRQSGARHYARQKTRAFSAARRFGVKTRQSKRLSPAGHFDMTAISFESIMKTLNRAIEIAAITLFAALMYFVFVG